MSGAFMVCAQTLAWSEKTAIAETTQKFRRQWRPALRERRSMYESCMNRIGLVHPLVGQPVANINWVSLHGGKTRHVSSFAGSQHFSTALLISKTQSEP